MSRKWCYIFSVHCEPSNSNYNWLSKFYYYQNVHTLDISLQLILWIPIFTRSTKKITWLCKAPLKLNTGQNILKNSTDTVMFAFPICPCMMIIGAVNWMIVWHKCRPLSTLICHRNTGNLLVICLVVCGQFSMWHHAICKITWTLFHFALGIIFVD